MESLSTLEEFHQGIHVARVNRLFEVSKGEEA